MAKKYSEIPSYAAAIARKSANKRVTKAQGKDQASRNIKGREVSRKVNLGTYR